MHITNGNNFSEFFPNWLIIAGLEPVLGDTEKSSIAYKKVSTIGKKKW